MKRVNNHRITCQSKKRDIKVNYTIIMNEKKNNDIYSPTQSDITMKKLLKYIVYT